jgi:hypothetical protein
MSYMTAIETMPRDLQMPMLKVLDAFQRDMREQLAVRREDFDKLQNTVAQLAEAQKRTEQRVEELAEAQKRTELRVEELAEAQKRTELRVEELAEAQKRTEQRVEELAEAQKRTEQRVEELAEAQKRTELAVQILAERQQVMGDQLGRTIGRQLESYYRDRAFAYFGRVLRKTRVVSLQDLEEEFESRLADREWEDVSLLDLVVRGQAAQHPERPDVLLVFEISAVIDRGDIERSLRRAALLRKVGFPVVPGVAGEDITQGALETAQKEHVFVVQNGHKDFWEDALAAALAA